MDGYLLDTNIISYWHDPGAAEHDHVVRRIEQLPAGTPLMTSVVVLGELEQGWCLAESTVQREEFQRWLQSKDLYILELRRSVAAAYGELRARLVERYGPKTKRSRVWPEQLADPVSGRELGIQENDIWIIAHALAYNLVLVTNDRRAVEAVRRAAPPGPRVENWAVS